MKIFPKFVGWTLLILSVILIGYGFYTYRSDPWLKALNNNDETALYYRPSKELQSTKAAFKDFLNKRANDSVKTIVYGMSFGGQLAVKIAKDNGANVDALVLDGTLESAHSFIADNVEGSIWKMLMKNPEDYNQDYIAIRDIAEISNIPKLIIHSKSDRAVPFERGQNVFNAAKEPKEFWETDTEHIKTLEVLPDETIEKISGLIQKSK